MPYSPKESPYPHERSPPPQATPPRTPAALPRLGRPHPSRLRRQAAAPGTLVQTLFGLSPAAPGADRQGLLAGSRRSHRGSRRQRARSRQPAGPDAAQCRQDLWLSGGCLRQRKALYRRRGERIARTPLGAESGRQRFGRGLCRRGQRASGRCGARAARHSGGALRRDGGRGSPAGAGAGAPGVDPPGRLFAAGGGGAQRNAPRIEIQRGADPRGHSPGDPPAAGGQPGPTAE